MNRNTELIKNKSSSETDLLADNEDAKSSPSHYNPGVSASFTKNFDAEESRDNLSDPKDEEEPINGHANGHQVKNDVSSSEISVHSEARIGLNGEILPTTDSDSCASPAGGNLSKSTRQKARKRKSKPLEPGNAKDWESNDSWTSERAQEDCTVVAEEIETKRRKIKSLQQKNRRLKVRHSRLKAAIKEMKANMADRE